MTIIKQSIVIILLFTIVGCSNKEEVEVTFERVEYETVEDLVMKIDYGSEDITQKRRAYRTYRYDYELLNNIVYTIKEDGLKEEYNEYVYNNGLEIHPLSNILTVNYLLEKDEYCDQEISSKWNDCYIKNEDEYIYNLRLMNFPVIVINSQEDDDILYVFEVKETEEFRIAIKQTNILLNSEEGSEEYNEALNWIMTTARSNGKIMSNEKAWEEFYIENLEVYMEDISELDGMSVKEIAENYDKYSDALNKIEDELSIIQ